MSSNATLVVVTDARDRDRLGFDAVLADTFLARGDSDAERRAGGRLVNLCRSSRYLSRGYYVSLLAEARGLDAVPSVHTMEAMNDPLARERALREAGVELIDHRERALRLRLLQVPPGERDSDELPPPVRDNRDEVVGYRLARPDELASALVCLGRCDDARFRRIAARVYAAWPVPLLRIKVVREEGRWALFELEPETISKLSDDEIEALRDALRAPTKAPEGRLKRRGPSLAVLYDDTDTYKASSPETIDRLVRLAPTHGLRVERLAPTDLHRLSDHDALFIRTLTGVDQPAWRFASRAEALGMPVIDDPRSIVRCSNKLYLYELLSGAGLATPKTWVVTRETKFEEMAAELGLPVVIKVPDGSFSAAVFKIATAEAYEKKVRDLLRRSPLLVAQEFVPTEFDWRIGVLDGRVLFAARYHMVQGHWQIRSLASGRVRYGRVDAVPRDRAPREVAKLATAAARLVGDGFYGVDIKEGPSGPTVIEVNDNPNLDLGYEDSADGDVVYHDLLAWFLRRLPKERPVRERAERVDRSERSERDKARNAALQELRRPIGRATRQHQPYKAWEVMGLELEYSVVDHDLNIARKVEDVLTLLTGRAASDAELGLVGISNEIVDHVLEIKHAVPLRSVARGEEVLVEGVRRVSGLLAARLDARLLPCGMHPWFDPKKSELWRRSNRRIYDTYARLFDVHTHGWSNVHAMHVNLPLGRDDEAVAMMNAARLLVPYLPAIAASSPMHDGALQPAVDARLHWIITHQARLPESCGSLVPEPIGSLTEYRRDILGRMYKAVDALPDSGAIRHEFLNARGAVFKFSRDSMEMRVIDVQECVRMDVAIATFVRRALRVLARELAAGKWQDVPQDVLVSDFHATVADGSRARVHATHLAGDAERGAAGTVTAQAALHNLLERAAWRVPAEEQPYLDLVASVIDQGSLSERIAARLEPLVADEDAFTEAARRTWIELSQCLVENVPWQGRAR